MLPAFTGATQFNVGLDETFDLGKVVRTEARLSKFYQGQSKEECEKKGVQVVYLEFLCKIYNILKKDFPDFTMQFWCVIICSDPV